MFVIFVLLEGVLSVEVSFILLYGNSTLFTYVLMVGRVTPRISYHIHQSHSAFSKSNFSNNPLYPPNYPLPPPPFLWGIHYPRQIQKPAFDTYRQKKKTPLAIYLGQIKTTQVYTKALLPPTTNHPHPPFADRLQSIIIIAPNTQERPRVVALPIVTAISYLA